MKTGPGNSSPLAIGAAVLAALGASVCCVLPLVLVLLGISGAWIGNLAAFDRWRPLFMSLTLLALGIAFVTLYGPAARRCATGLCGDPARLRTRRRLLWMATLAIALLVLFPYYIGWFF
ncbi:MAG: mercury transporter MerT [Lysobacter sp.]|nr:MAG: mercury transporter MerT [Lysobacter sp.]